MEYFTGIVFTIFAFFFMYMSSHIVEEKKQGKRMPLPWEKED